MIDVLIAEDNITVVNVLKAFFDKVDGFNIVKVCNNGLSALDYLQKNTVDLLLLDISMPVMNGFTLVEKLRKNQNYVDVIFVTAMNNTQSVKNALKYGAVDYMVKPFSFERFLCTMQNYKVRYSVLNKQRTINQNEIDKIINHSIDTTFNTLLPKGITQITLNEIFDVIETFEKEFTLEDLLKKINMSKVALRNYMGFLIQEGILEKQIQRGSVGRPQFIYKIIE